MLRSIRYFKCNNFCMIKKSVYDLDDKYPVPSACFLINVLTSNEEHIFLFALYQVRSALSFLHPFLSSN